MNYSSPMGEILITCDSLGLTGLWFSDQKYFPENIGQTHRKANHLHIQYAAHWLDIYFSGREPHFAPSLHISTTAFRAEVIGKMLEIPYGKTISYGELAESLGRGRLSAQAVGGAVGHNPVSIIVPCHRVLGAGNRLTGYAGGIGRKLALLTLEGVDPSEIFV